MHSPRTFRVSFRRVFLRVLRDQYANHQIEYHFHPSPPNCSFPGGRWSVIALSGPDWEASQFRRCRCRCRCRCCVEKDRVQLDSGQTLPQVETAESLPLQHQNQSAWYFRGFSRGLILDEGMTCKFGATVEGSLSIRYKEKGSCTNGLYGTDAT